jgi:hypothetical protein
MFCLRNFCVVPDLVCCVQPKLPTSNPFSTLMHYGFGAIKMTSKGKGHCDCSFHYLNVFLMMSLV